MKKQFNLSIIGSAFAFVLATICCWLPPLLAVLVGGSVGVSAFWVGLESFSGSFMAIGVALLAYIIWQFFQNKKTAFATPRVILQSLLTCPKCSFQKMETMPTNACQYFHECENCQQVLKPLAGDCCVYCSFGTVKCPPIQMGDKNCCV